MTQPGYVHFEESRIFGTAPVVDGMSLGHIPFPVEKVPSGGVHILEHANNTRTRQIAYIGDTDPEMPGRHYEFRFEMFARDEAVWWKLDELDKLGSSFYFVPWEQEQEVFLVGRALAAWVLPRPTAASQLDAGEHPDVTSYTTLAWLDGVAQDVVVTGTPGAGEVKVLVRDVTTPTLAAGQVLKIRYAPAYLVAVTALGPTQLNAYNDLVRPVVLTEVREST